MTEYEKAEQDVAAAKVAERIAEWKAMEAKAAYYRYAGEAMAASAEVMGARIRRDNAVASEFVEKAQAAALSPAPSEEAGKGGDAGAGYDEQTDLHESAMEAAAIARDLEAQPAPLDAFQEPETRAGESPYVPFELLSEDALRHTHTIPGGLQKSTGTMPDIDPDTKIDVIYVGGWGQTQRAGDVDWSSPSIDFWHHIALPTQAERDAAKDTQPLPPLLPPEPPPAATPEQLIEAGAINGEAYGLWRKLAKEPA